MDFVFRNSVIRLSNPLWGQMRGICLIRAHCFNLGGQEKVQTLKWAVYKIQKYRKSSLLSGDV